MSFRKISNSHSAIAHIPPISPLPLHFIIDFSRMSTKRDYYSVLEVPKTASPSDIKKAYRSLALKWHPDKNPNNRHEAEEKFKEIAEAYAVLSDPQKKQHYDMYGFETPGAGGFEDFGNAHFGFGDAENIFRTFFGGKDPFAEFMGEGLLGGGLFGSGKRGRSSDFFAGFGGFGGFDEGFEGFSSMGNGATFFSSSSSSSSGARGTSKSVSKKTFYRDGQQVTVTETTIRHPDGRVETSTTEETAGEPQRLTHQASSGERRSIKKK